MKTLKIISLLLLLIGLLYCRNDDNGKEPETVEEPFDITDYVLVALAKDDNQFSTFILTFEKEAQGKSIEYHTFAPIEGYNYNYTFVDGIVKIYSAGYVIREFKIQNKTIVSANNADQLNYKLALVKISNINQLNGNTYVGSWRVPGTNTQYAVNLRFSGTHYSESYPNPIDPNHEYKIIKNVAAYSIEANKRSLWILVDGKLEGYRQLFPLAQQIGTFQKQ